MMNQILAIGLGILAVLSFILMVRSRHFIKTLLFTAATGIGALVTVCWLGAFTGVLLALNSFTVIVAGLLGIPGVLTMLALRLLFRL